MGRRAPTWYPALGPTSQGTTKRTGSTCPEARTEASKRAAGTRTEGVCMYIQMYIRKNRYVYIHIDMYAHVYI